MMGGNGNQIGGRRLTRRVALSLALALGVAAAAPQARALDVAAAQGFVETFVSDLRRLVENDRSGAAGAAEFLTLLEGRAAVDSVGKFAVGRAWREMSATQKGDYQTAFRSYIARTYQNRFGDYAGEDIVVTAAKSAGNKGVLVNSRLKRPGAPDLQLEWLVSDRSGETRLSDVLFEGVSLAITLRETFGGMIEARGGDLDRFIVDLAASNGA